MGIEIERKFLVKDNSYKRNNKGRFYTQGYINTNPECVVRIRAEGNIGYITIKGKRAGATRLEYQYEIPYNEALEILERLCEKPLIEKTRFVVEYKGFTWEIDEFAGENEGLVIAEIELENEKKDFPIPEWVGLEVTDDNRYYNSNLITNPYRDWNKQ